ncbi:MAG: CRISPR-associated protein Cas5 [Akkermansiaceae bacterium]
MAMQPPVFYKPSQKCPPRSTLLGILAVLVVSPIAAGLYALAIFYCPFIYINFFLTLGLGFVVGGAVGKGVYIGKMRNPKVAGIMGILSGLFAVYAQWSVWIFIATGFTVLPILPQDILYVIQMIAEEGAWEIFGMAPTGIMLYLIWLIEAVAIVIISTLTATSISDGIFCEVCDRWVGEDEELSTRRFAYGDDEKFLDSVIKGALAGDVLKLNSLTTAEDGSNEYLLLEIFSCNSCEIVSFLSLCNVKISFNDQGEPQAAKDYIITKMLLKPDEIEFLREKDVTLDS